MRTIKNKFRSKYFDYIIQDKKFDGENIDKTINKLRYFFQFLALRFYIVNRKKRELFISYYPSRRPKWVRLCKKTGMKMNLRSIIQVR